MLVKMFSIRDKLSGFSYPTVDISAATAQRNFAAAINNPGQTSMSFSPGDYDLYEIGSFDTEKGLFSGTESGVPEFIVSGASLINVKE